MKSISSLDEALTVLRSWMNSSRQMVVVASCADMRSTFSVQGYIAELYAEWLVVAGEKAGHVALLLVGLECGVTDAKPGSADPIDIAKEKFPSSEVSEIGIPEGGSVLLRPSPINPS